MKYFDAHTHVQFAAFKTEWQEVIERARARGVTMINVGTQRDTSEGAIKTAEAFETGVYAAVGLHPIHTEKSHHDGKELGEGEAAQAFISRGEEFDYEVYKKLALHPKVVAIGECGLDYYRLSEETKRKQFEVFEQHIVLAHEVKKPLMIHCRNAFPDLIQLLTTNYQLLNTIPGVIHFFTGTVENTKDLLELGFSFTFGGVTTFTRDYDAVLEYLPLDRILSETDAPYVAPVPYRGKTNEPAYVVEVVQKLAEIKGVSEEVMADQIIKNAERVFKV
ncbi:MAG: TatD family hydrolase [Patescibacteria group bacterium]